MQKGELCLKKWILFLSICLLPLLGIGSAAAQTATGTINGTLTDPQGLAMSGVSVDVTDIDTGVEHVFMSNATGLYVAPLLEPGNYEIIASKDGFNTVDQKGVMLLVAQTLTVDIKMSLKTAEGTITVTSEVPLIETDKTEQSQIVSQTLVDGLPLVARRWENFVLLTPAVTTDGTSGLSSFRGLSSLYNGNSVDGANNTQAFFSEARGRAIIVSYVYSADSIKEFQVASSNYSAELGQAAGGVVNAVTKSGTNDLHADLFYNLRYPALNALDPLAKSGGIRTQTVHQQQQFGGSVGTPIIKDKLFFFATYDGFRKVNPILYTSSTSNSAINGFVCPTGAGITVTAAQCAAAKAFITTDLLGAFPRTLDQDVFFGKLDYELNQTNHLSAAFNWQNWKEPYGYVTAPTVNNGGATQNGSGGTHERFFIANWTSTFSSNKVNEVRFAWGRDFEFDGTNSPGPAVNLSNIAQYGENIALPRFAFPDEHRYQVSDNFSLVKGAHTIKTGVDLNFIHELLANLFQGDGSYQYTNIASIANCPAGPNATFCYWLADSVGSSLGDALTGKHWATFTQVNDPITHIGKDDFYDNDLGLYIEDTWKLRPSLTLNLGVRYDLQHVPSPPMPNTGSPLLTFYTSTLNTDTNNVAPRLGVAWQFDKDTVLRVGYGIFYGKTSNSTYYALRVENGEFQKTYGGCNATATLASLRACAPTFPNLFFTPPGPPVAAPFAGALTPAVVIPGGVLPSASAVVHGMSPNFVNPAAHEGEITIEHQLPGRMSILASYLLTRGLHLPSSYDANVAPATQTRSYDVLTGTAVGSSTLLTTAPLPFYTQRIEPATGVILNQASIVNSWYNGLVLSLRKPMSHDVELLLNYTYSKSLDDGQVSGANGTFYGTDGVLDPLDIKRDYSYSDLDQRHRFVGSVVWAPSYGKDLSNAVVRQLASGWTVSGILTSSTGEPAFQPNSPYSGVNISAFTPAGAVDGGMTGGEVSSGGSPTGGRAGWLARNAFHMPSYNNIDFRLGRSFTYHERYRLDLDADAFNLFNSTIVGAVNTTAYNYLTPGTGACAGHTNGCFVPNLSSSGVPIFGSENTTSGALYGARQLQVGLRFEF